MASQKSVMLMGVGYFPWLTAGEKNFFWRLLPLIRRHTPVTVFSLNDYHQDRLMQDTPDGAVPIYCARRPFHRDYTRFYFEADGYTAYHHRHAPAREALEKIASLLVHGPRLRRLVRQHDIGLVHFMDNFGPAMPLLQRILPRVKVTFSAAIYDLRGRPETYHRYLRLSLGHLDALGVYTNAYAQKLREIGIQTPYQLTPWGVHVPEMSVPEARRREIRRQLGVPEGLTFVLWSGYLQQIQEPDFYRTIRLARQVVANRADISFVFAFKPETYRPQYGQEAGERIQVLTGVQRFGEFLETADLFCSPIGNINSTVSPPLTWLEAMSRGTPVLTTRVGGVDEAIDHGRTGLLAHSYEAVADLLIQLPEKEELARIGTRAQALVRERYTVQQSAERYLRLWREVMDHTET